ncbi:MAG TPA: hypothetical protein VNZ53_29065 [Steroidobacteraceae bacterium]|jgi:hypothetical protein|nr:hypothetical protein [Steroidobacteraceae bacterium]
MRGASGFALAGVLTAAPAMAADTLASIPSSVSVTVYRAPDRGSGSINLDELEGFALISETRTVHLPAGRPRRLRFEGVADGIEPASAIVTGLSEGVIEKNREGKLLSPAALIAAALNKPVTLLRTDKKTGKLVRLAGTIRSDADGGVVFETAQGIEALRCSGMPETFSFTGVGELAATPTLSVLARSSEPVTQTVTLSYLARNFDWAADYVATVAADGKSLDLGAWVTLANGNGVGFPSAHTQVVAGRVNRENGEVEPLDPGGPILAQCWPRGSTSDPQFLQFAGTSREMTELGINDRMYKMAVAAPAALDSMVVTAARRVEQEQLGDLKLYRVPDRTTLASRQSKQVRLLDRSSIPITRVYGADLAADESAASAPASLLLRTTNDTAHHLGLPLPSGRIAVFAARGGETILLHESGMRDLAIAEEVEIDLGDSPDVQVAATKEKNPIDAAQSTSLPPLPGVAAPRSAPIGGASRVDISNARASEIQFELRLRLPAGARVTSSDHILGAKNGRPIFRLTIPAHKNVTVRYQWQRAA